jgi:hypothetical protein
MLSGLFLGWKSSGRVETRQCLGGRNYTSGGALGTPSRTNNGDNAIEHDGACTNMHSATRSSVLSFVEGGSLQQLFLLDQLLQLLC